MKRISFKDSGGLNLTKAVLSGRKKMTRIAVPIQVYAYAIEYARYESDSIRAKFEYILKNSPYKVGDVVAIQQAYIAINDSNMSTVLRNELERSAGFRNKMFVKAELMPHHIRITDISIERLQDISDEDCMREGVLFSEKYVMPYGIPDYPHYGFFYYHTPSEAFASLIDKVCGLGTWNSNPLVWAYNFELVD